MINSGKVYRYADQDVLNILLNGRVHYLDKKYNNKTTLSVRCDEEQKLAQHNYNALCYPE